jgi:hypothetical protein
MDFQPSFSSTFVNTFTIFSQSKHSFNLLISRCSIRRQSPPRILLELCLSRGLNNQRCSWITSWRLCSLSLTSSSRRWNWLSCICKVRRELTSTRTLCGLCKTRLVGSLRKRRRHWHKERKRLRVWGGKSMLLNSSWYRQNWTLRR